MSNHENRSGVLEVDPSTPEEMIADLVNRAQATLRMFEETLPEGSTGPVMKILPIRPIDFDFVSLQETTNRETGLKQYEYAERDPRDRAQKRIFKWEEGGDTITRLSGFVNRPDLELKRGATWQPTSMDHTMLRGRLHRLIRHPIKKFITAKTEDES